MRRRGGLVVQGLLSCLTTFIGHSRRSLIIEGNESNQRKGTEAAESDNKLTWPPLLPLLSLQPGSFRFNEWKRNVKSQAAALGGLWKVSRDSTLLQFPRDFLGRSWKEEMISSDAFFSSSALKLVPLFHPPTTRGGHFCRLSRADTTSWFEESAATDWVWQMKSDVVVVKKLLVANSLWLDQFKCGGVM